MTEIKPFAHCETNHLPGSVELTEFPSVSDLFFLFLLEAYAEAPSEIPTEFRLHMWKKTRQIKTIGRDGGKRKQQWEKKQTEKERERKREGTGKSGDLSVRAMRSDRQTLRIMFVSAGALITVFLVKTNPLVSAHFQRAAVFTANA